MTGLERVDAAGKKRAESDESFPLLIVSSVRNSREAWIGFARNHNELANLTHTRGKSMKVYTHTEFV